MRNQATSRGDMAGNSRDERGQYGGSDGWTDGDYELRSGHRYAAGQEPADEQDYDPRAYAPNPDEPYGYDDDGRPIYYEPEDKPLKSGSRSGMLMVGAVLAIAVIGGAGAVGYKMIGSGTSGETPLIRAETEPVKTTPDRSNETAQQNKAIYDRVDPANSQKSKVVSREEQPVDLPAAPSSEPRADGSRIILPGGPAQAEPTPPDTQGAEPRRVKTVPIRPDAAAAAQPAPGNDPIAEAARTGQAPRQSEFDNGILSDGAAPGRGAAPAPRTGVPAGPSPQPQQQQAARVPPPQTTPAAPRPAAAPTPPRSEPQQVAALPPRAPAGAVAAPATRPAPGGGFVVQVTSQRSEADARAAYANLQKRFPQVLAPYQASIQSASVGDRGTYYRVRVGPFSNNNDASTVCNNLRAAGGDCVVSRN